MDGISNESKTHTIELTVRLGTDDHGGITNSNAKIVGKSMV